MTLRTTYFGAIGAGVDPHPDDLVLGVVRRAPDWVAHKVDRNVPVLGPPDPLLDVYRQVEAVAEEDDSVGDPAAVAWRSVSFRERYLDHLDREGPQQVIETIRDDLDERAVWLVCFEKRDCCCHRRLLAAVIRDETPARYDAPEVYEQPEGADSDDVDAGEQAGLHTFAGVESHDY